MNRESYLQKQKRDKVFIVLAEVEYPCHCSKKKKIRLNGDAGEEKEEIEARWKRSQ